jgi:hypothetical protein
MPYKDNKWEPNPKQAPFLSIPTSIKEAAYLGGAGSGKSDVLLMYGIVNQWYTHPLFKQVFLRRTYPELRNEIVPRSRDYYRPFGAKFNKSEMVWRFPREDQYGAGTEPDGAYIFLGHCENEDDVHKYDSMEINLFTPDEITSFTDWIYLYIGFTRVRTSVKELPAIIRSAGMPGGIGHTWVNKRFILPCREPVTGKLIDRQILRGKGGNKRILIFATQADNKEHIDPNYAQSLEALPEAEKRAKLYGDFDAYIGQVFDEFRDKKYPEEPDNALHVIEPFEIPEWWPKFIIGDWGFAAHTWIGYFAISPERRLYLYREHYWQKVRIEEWTPYVKEYVEKEQPRFVKFCKSAGQDRGQEHTIQQQISDGLGTSIELSSNSPGSRIAGKQLLHEYFRWKPRHIPKQDIRLYDEERASWILRNQGLTAYKSYMSSFDDPIPETNLPKYQIFNTCPNAINAIKSCVYAKPQNGVPSEDVMEFDGDDPYDGQRYAVDSADRYFQEAEEEWNRVKKQEELVNRLKETNDWTMYYRQMRASESESSVQAVSRYHRSR